MKIIIENLITGITLGSIYALISIGMTMVYGLLKILHVAHASVYVFGAYMGLILHNLTGNIWISIAGAAMSSALMGWGMYLSVYKRIQNEKPLISLIVGIGLYTSLSDIYRLIGGPYSIAFEHRFPFSNIEVNSITFSPHQFLVIITAVAMLGLTWYVVNRTKTGMAWQASAQDREAAISTGVNANYYFCLNFMFGSAIAGVAGVLVSIYYGGVNPNMGDVWAYKVFVIMVLGGLGNVFGTIIASFLIGLMETFIVSLWGYFLPRDAIAFIIMILVLILMPSGIMGRRKSD